MLSSIKKPSMVNFPQNLNLHLDFCEHQAPTYIENFAITSYLAIVSNSCGQKILTPTRLPLNLYTVNLAFSTSGKDFYHNIVSDVFNDRILGLGDMVGYDEPSSANALHLCLKKNPVMIVTFDEIGRVLLSTKTKNSPLYGVMRALISLYSKGTKKNDKKAFYANPEKEPIVINYPCFSFYGTTNARTFWRSMGDDEVIDGFLGRLLVFDSGNAKYEFNDDSRVPMDYPYQIIQLIKNITEANCFNKQSDIDQEADELMREYMRSVFGITNDYPQHVATPTLNRSVAMAWKLATILAVSECMATTHIPEVVINKEHVQVALYLAMRSVKLVLRGLGYKLSGGKLILTDGMDTETPTKYHVHKDRMYQLILQNPDITLSQICRAVPGRYLNFKQRRDILQDLIDAEMIEEKTGPGATKPTLMYKAIFSV